MHQVVLAAAWIEDPKLNPKTRERRFGAWILRYSLSFGGLGQLLVSEVSVQVIVACVAAAASTGIRWYLSPKGSAGRWTAHFSPRGRSGSMSTDSGNQKTYQPMDVDIYGAADTLLHLNQVVYRFLRWELVEWCKTTRLIIFWAYWILCVFLHVSDCFYVFSRDSRTVMHKLSTFHQPWVVLATFKVSSCIRDMQVLTLGEHQNAGQRVFYVEKLVGRRYFGKVSKGKWRARELRL